MVKNGHFMTKSEFQRPRFGGGGHRNRKRAFSSWKMNTVDEMPSIVKKKAPFSLTLPVSYFSCKVANFQ